MSTKESRKAEGVSLQAANRPTFQEKVREHFDESIVMQPGFPKLIRALTLESLEMRPDASTVTFHDVKAAAEHAARLAVGIARDLLGPPDDVDEIFKRARITNEQGEQ